MIQELFGVIAAAGGDTKISMNNNGSIFLDSSPSSTHSLSAASSTTAAAITTVATTTSSTTSSNNNNNNNNSEGQNLRCPRCDSSNTKFCYYNNYNLTQPRHFCKTCRRYWTKGGALRNVPIGGGCRKNKSSAAATVAAAVGKSASGKMKTVSSSSSEMGRVGLLATGFDHEIMSSPTQILWGSPQNSHLLAILRSATQNQNPNPNLVIAEPAAAPTTPFPARAMGFDPLNHIPSLGLCSSYWRNNQTQLGQQQNGYGGRGGDQVHGGAGIQELYQKLRSSSSNYLTDGGHQGSVGVTNVGTTATATAAVLESSPVGGGESTGYWNNPASFWSDVHASAANGAYP